MAFGLRRWLIAALAGCALVAVAFLPPERERIPRLLLYRYPDHEAHLRGVLSRYRSQLQLLELRDSILQVAAATPAEGEPLLLVQEWFPQAVQDTIRALAEEALDKLRSRFPGQRVLVAVTSRDGVSPFMWAGTYGRLYYYLPSATDGETCLVTLALGRADPEEKWLRSISSFSERQAMLGPCAYYAVFGPPGQHIEGWLESTDFRAAMSPAWASDSQPLGPIEPQRRSYLRYYEPALYGCAAGNRRACRLGFFASEYWNWRQLVAERQPGIVPRSYRYYALDFPHSERLLSDLLADMGFERFARFWSSDADVEAAFAQAFGVELAEWMMGWNRVQVGRVERPVPRPTSAVLGLLLAAVVVSGTTFYVRGRQVS